MSYAFQKLDVSESDKVWLQAISSNPGSSDRELRISLLSQLDEKFNPEELFRCLFYETRKLSLIGLWYLNPKNPIFKMIESVVATIWSRLQENPSIESVSSKMIAEKAQLPVEQVEEALGHISKLPKFSSGGKPSQGRFGYEWIYISSSFESVSAYRNFKNIFEEMNDFYIKSQQPNTAYNFSDSPTLALETLGQQFQAKNLHTIEPNTAFIIMPINSKNAELEEVNKVIKEVCKLFNITAVRADDIEHSKRITDVILKKIQTSQHIIADLSNERPNVYYEIGYAHAVGKYPILYCKEGTNLHFDLKDYNVPSYQGVLDLRDKLKKRFQEITGKSIE